MGRRGWWSAVVLLRPFTAQAEGLSERTALGFPVEVPFFFEPWSRDGGPASLQPVSSFACGPRVGVGVEHAVSPAVLPYVHARSAC